MPQARKESASPYQLPKLPWARNALEPSLSAETIDYHYGKHHRGYIDKLNALVPGTEYAGLPLEDLVLHASGAVFLNAAQAWNHSFYWRCLTPRPLPPPVGPFTAAIKGRFGSFSAFGEDFRSTAMAKFGSGWTWLVLGGGGYLEIRNTDDADTPLRHGQVPLLVCDVWEHAYYIDYRNNRADYLDAWWRMVDWNAVAQNHAQAVTPSSAA